MVNGPQTGGTHTYDYDAAYCEKAAKAFGELLTLVENGKTLYKLAGFKDAYKNLYDHEKADGASDCYSEIWFTYRQNGKMPGASETMFQAINLTWGNGGPNSYMGYNYVATFCPNQLAGWVGSDNLVHHPTANYVEYYGMANGLPIDDPDSGYDPDIPTRTATRVSTTTSYSTVSNSSTARPTTTRNTHRSTPAATTATKTPPAPQATS